MNSIVSFQTVVEYVEALAPEEQDLLIELIQKRRIAQRRAEIARNAEQTMQNWRAGKAQCGSLDDLKADLTGAE